MKSSLVLWELGAKLNPYSDSTLKYSIQYSWFLKKLHFWLANVYIIFNYYMLMDSVHWTLVLTWYNTVIDSEKNILCGLNLASNTFDIFPPDDNHFKLLPTLRNDKKVSFLNWTSMGRGIIGVWSKTILFAFINFGTLTLLLFARPNLVLNQCC